MPTDSKESLLTLATKILDTDYLRIVKDPGGTPLSQNILAAIVRVTQIEGLKLIRNSGTSLTVDKGTCIAENGDLIVVNTAITVSSLVLSASTWYHLYIYLNSGVPTVEVVTTAPVAWKGTAWSKTGNTARRYIGSVLTDGSSNVKNFVHDVFNNLIVYQGHQINVAPHRVLTGGTATAATAVALAGIIPVTALLSYVRTLSTSNQIAYTSESNTVGATQCTTASNVGSVAPQANYLYHPVDASQQIWYLHAAVVGSGGFNLDVMGYLFLR